MDKGKAGKGCITNGKPDVLPMPKAPELSDFQKRALQPGGVARPAPKTGGKPNNFGF